MVQYLKINIFLCIKEKLILINIIKEREERLIIKKNTVVPRFVAHVLKEVLRHYSNYFFPFEQDFFALMFAFTI